MLLIKVVGTVRNLQISQLTMNKQVITIIVIIIIIIIIIINIVNLCHIDSNIGIF